MTKKQITTTSAPNAVGPYSQAILADNFLFTAGQIAINPQTNKFNPEQSIEEQTHQVMKNLQAILKAENLDFIDVVKTEIFVQNMDDFKIVNEIYGSYFKEIIPPARQTVEVSKLPLGAKIEISCLAVKK